MLPTSASFLITEDCNLACKYCFEKHNSKSMKEEIAKRGLEFLALNAVKEHKAEFHAMLFGGEPLLNIDLIDYIFHTGEDLAKKYNIMFTTSLITNATIMSDKIYDVLSWHKNRSNLTVQLSVDGNKKTQDMYRVTKTGKGSFNLVKKNIETFKKLFEDDPYKLCIHGCVNKKTLPSLYDNYAFFKHEWGMQNIWFLPVMEEKWTKEDVVIYDQQNELIFNDISLDLQRTRDLSIINSYAPMDRCLANGRADKPCGAGDSFVTITASGDIFPCHQIYFNDPDRSQYLGNVFDGLVENGVRSRYEEYTSADMNCPSDCKNDQCYRCIAVNFIKNKDILKQVKGNYCEFMCVDRKYQNKLKNFAENLGLLNLHGQHQCSGECLCNAREGSSNNGCDVVAKNSVCESGNNINNPDCLCDCRGAVTAEPILQPYNNEFEETVSAALSIILEKLDNIEKQLSISKTKES